ncbi:hypothetical protein [Pseudomonas aeruginosa]|uniref:hypothetical protein n=1 Tax=Pseudomonas aeruginosa TaxID=287 RepID=UPI0003BAEA48|nr:hypothetical protein [Pseudomonas aeruginosa]EKV3063041.1 hypothetical protein [Pseudomonas aeruginosa]EKY0573846.1 hypothetical protein [Pseudomonas aeruginosa]ERX36965.1 hypothetical protein Q009_02722 [Pseudomonas aeruginosa U2504]MBK3718201.1 hypothetical protein [Pseudomonas aeruginosa]MDU0602377.1 hypothetical protein [Pseudomonas aeruginosa]
MTDHAELRRVAALAHPDAEWFIARNLDHPNIDKPAASFIATATPKAVLALLDEIDRLKAENESLLDELSACTEHPGGCGYWREAAKRRTEERDQLKAENEALRGAVEQLAEMLNSIHVPIDLNEILKGAKQ